jgi:hypothetical protein
MAAVVQVRAEQHKSRRAPVAQAELVQTIFSITI